MFSDDVINKVMQVVQKKVGSVFGEVDCQVKFSVVILQWFMFQFDLCMVIGVDFVVIVEQYKNFGKKIDDFDVLELIVFVFLLMLEVLFKWIGQQVKQVGVVVVFCGIKFGFCKGIWIDLMNVFKLVVDIGVDVQIYLELFGCYNVLVVLIVVVVFFLKVGCQDDVCVVMFVVVVGDVLLDYVLDQFMGCIDIIGKIVCDCLKWLCNS